MTNETDTTPAPRDPEIEALLAPIPGDNRVGESLRYDGTFDAIQEARREDDPTLPQGVWKTALKSANWKEVESLCAEALAGRSKDLQIAVWLTEAWARLRGIRGAAAGFRLLDELCKSYWDEIHPPIDAGDLDGRVAPFEWLNNRLAMSLKMVPITESGTVTWIDWENALHDDAQQARRPRSEDDDGEENRRAHSSAKDDITGHILATSTEFYRQLRAHLTEATGSLRRLHDELVERCDLQAPSVADIEETIAKTSHFVDKILREREAMEEATNPTPTDDGTDDFDEDLETSFDDDGAPVSSGPIRNRAEAYQMLNSAAEYLARIEPHSPTPYLVRRAITWGRMSLADLLRELLRDNADLPTVYTLLGIRQGDSYED